MEIRVNPFDDRPLEDITQFVNRDPERARVDRLLDSAAAGHAQNLAILGEDGMGKTSLVNYLRARAGVFPTVRAVHLPIDQETSAQSLAQALSKRLLDSARMGLGTYLLGLIGLGRADRLEAIRERLEDLNVEREYGVDFHLLNLLAMHESTTRPVGGADAWTATAETLAELIACLSPQVRTVYVLLDEGQYVARDSALTLLQRMRLLFQRAPYAVCLAGTPPLFEQLNLLEPTFVNLFPEANRLLLPPMGRTHVEELLERRLSPVRIGGSGTDPFLPEAVQRLTAASAGNPRYIVRCAAAALDLALAEAGPGRALVVRSAHVAAAVQKVHAVLGLDQFLRLSEPRQLLAQAVHAHPGASVTALAGILGKSKSVVARDVAALTELGVLRRRRVGREVQVEASAPIAAYFDGLEGGAR